MHSNWFQSPLKLVLLQSYCFNSAVEWVRLRSRRFYFALKLVLTGDSNGFLCSRMGFALRRIRLTLPSTGFVCPAVEWVALCTRLGYFAVELSSF